MDTSAKQITSKGGFGDGTGEPKTRINILVRDGKNLEVPVGTTLLNIAASYEDEFQYPILGARFNNELVDLYTEITKPGNINF